MDLLAGACVLSDLPASSGFSALGCVGGSRAVCGIMHHFLYAVENDFYYLL